MHPYTFIYNKNNAGPSKPESQCQTFVHTREAHERHSQQTGCNKRDGHAAHTLRDIDKRKLLSDARKDDEREGETQRSREGIDNTCEQVVVLLDDKDSHTQDTAVGGDERKEDPQRLIERGRHLLEDDLNHLHERRDDQDESYGLQVAQRERIEQQLLYEVGHYGGEHKHESHRHAHADSSLDLLRHAQERTDAEELRQHDIVYEYRCDKYKNVFHKMFLSLTVKLS